MKKLSVLLTLIIAMNTAYSALLVVENKTDQEVKLIQYMTHGGMHWDNSNGGVWTIKVGKIEYIGLTKEVNSLGTTAKIGFEMTINGKKIGLYPFLWIQLHFRPSNGKKGGINISNNCVLTDPAFGNWTDIGKEGLCDPNPVWNDSSSVIKNYNNKYPSEDICTNTYLGLKVATKTIMTTLADDSDDVIPLDHKSTLTISYSSEQNSFSQDKWSCVEPIPTPTAY